jgi:hypothetical protein
MDYNEILAELRDSLERADLLVHWKHSGAYERVGRTRVEFLARIKVREDAHRKPGGVEFADADIELELEYTDDAGLDAVKVCAAQVTIDGIDRDARIVRYALHFDRHDPDHESTELHSRFHWQVGGERLEAQEFGTVLYLQGPRFPWHPIDPVLLVDFVLGHFNGAKRSDLVQPGNDRRYLRILHAAQTQHVAPFFAHLQERLSENPFTETAYWPSLCGAPTG